MSTSHVIIDVMERPEQNLQEPAADELVERVRDELERAEHADDGTRLDVLEGIRRDLEAELDSSLENGTSRH